VTSPVLALPLGLAAAVPPAEEGTSPRQAEREAIEACRRGEREAFDRLVLRYQRDVYRLCYRYVNSHEDANDLAQEVFLKAWRAIGRFRGDSSFRTWLYRIAYRGFLSELRRNEPQTEELGEQHAVTEAGDGTEAKAFMEDFEVALRQLTPAQRDAVHFSLQRGFSHPEIADIMDLPIGTVKTHVLRGRQKLQALLSDWQEGFSDE
jgi:RNA polymerase sigma-70 factor (ECF subfamily)